MSRGKTDVSFSVPPSWRFEPDGVLSAKNGLPSALPQAPTTVTPLLSVATVCELPRATVVANEVAPGPCGPVGPVWFQLSAVSLGTHFQPLSVSITRRAPPTVL